MKAEDLEQEFLDHINQAELIQSEDNLWTLGYRRPEDGEFRGCKDFFSMTSAMKYYHQSQLQALKRQVESMPSKNIRMQVAWDYPGYEGSKEFISKDIVLNLITNLEDNG